jgi:hypothetical protein
MVKTEAAPKIVSGPNATYQDSHEAKEQRTVINRLDCGFLQLVVVASEELEYMKVRTHKVGTR